MLNNNITQYQLISEPAALALLERLVVMDKAYFVDSQNKGLDGTFGNYQSCFNRAIPKDILKTLIDITPGQNNALCQVIINYYPVGGFSPKHIDSGDHLGCEVLTLDNRSCGAGMEFDDNCFVSDKAGFCYKFNDLKAVHWVNQVQTPRFSVVYLFGGNDELS